MESVTIPTIKAKQINVPVRNKKFFNIYRNRYLVGEIIQYLSPLDKFKCLGTSGITFRQMKKKLHFEDAFAYLESVSIADLGEIKYLDLYKNVLEKLKLDYSEDFKDPSKKENQILVYVISRFINNKVIEPKRFTTEIKKKLRPFSNQSLVFYKGKLTKFEMPLVFNLLQHNKSVKLLQLRGCDINDDNLKLLLSCLTKNTTLEKLDLMYNNLTDESCNHLENFLSHGSNITCLSIGMNTKITLKGLQRIQSGLISNGNLKHLGLQGMKMNSSHNALIDSLIGINSPVEILDLSNNNFDKGSIKSWEVSLSKNKVLKEINLAANSFKDNGATILAKILKTHSSLRRIDLRANDLTKSSYDCLKEACFANPNIEYINFVDNNMKDSQEAFKQCVKGIHK